MNRPHELPTSPQRMSPQDTALLVVDVQQKLVPLIHHQERIVWNIRRLLDAAKLFEMRVLASEQYPQGLGGTIPLIAGRLPSVAQKTRFSCGACGELFDGLFAEGIRKLLVCGIETHVCVQQSCLDLITAGFEVYIAVDAVGSRSRLDHDMGLRRMETSGMTLTSTEAVLFEWCDDARSPQFKSLSQLVREAPPVDPADESQLDRS